jgi:histone acetyltransferase (RNA polymerase elongator complex component)
MSTQTQLEEMNKKCKHAEWVICPDCPNYIKPDSQTPDRKDLITQATHKVLEDYKDTFQALADSDKTPDKIKFQESGSFGRQLITFEPATNELRIDLSSIFTSSNLALLEKVEGEVEKINDKYELNDFGIETDKSEGYRVALEQVKEIINRLK